MIPLTQDERDRYEWQMWVENFGEEGQTRLKNSAVLISRTGGVGGTVAYYLAAAGIGKLVIAHGGNVKPSDLNRQLLMTTDWLGKPRIESVRRRLPELNPNVEVVGVGENVSEANAAELVGQVDVVVDGAPLFEERYAMNRQAVLQGKPLVESAMFSMEATLTTVVPGETACLACITPEKPDWWIRQFPVIGAVSGSVAAMAAMEVIKLITGIGRPLKNRMLVMDLGDMHFRTVKLHRDPACRVCGEV